MPHSSWQVFVYCFCDQSVLHAREEIYNTDAVDGDGIYAVPRSIQRKQTDSQPHWSGLYWRPCWMQICVGPFFRCRRTFWESNVKSGRPPSLYACVCVLCATERYDTRTSSYTVNRERTPVKSTPHKFITNQKWAKAFASGSDWVRASRLNEATLCSSPLNCANGEHNWRS